MSSMQVKERYAFTYVGAGEVVNRGLGQHGVVL